MATKKSGSSASSLAGKYANISEKELEKLGTSAAVKIIRELAGSVLSQTENKPKVKK